MEIEKRIVKTYRVAWCKKNYAVFDAEWRYCNKETISCFRCDRMFSEGEKIALIGIRRRDDREVCCSDCAREIANQLFYERSCRSRFL